MIKFFAVTTAAFEFQRNIAAVFGTSNKKLTRMYELHIMAQTELDKENPDMKEIDRLLRMMEKETKTK